MWEYRAQITKVVDGDTVDVKVDLGFAVTISQRVRLAGLDAPERYTELGRACVRYVLDWVTFQQNDALTPFPITLRSERPMAGDKYGRYLATVVGPDGTVLNNLLVSSGHARSWDGRGVRPSAPPSAPSRP